MWGRRYDKTILRGKVDKEGKGGVSAPCHHVFCANDYKG